MKRNRLNPTFVRNVTKAGRYSDGATLTLLVQVRAGNVTKSWVQRLTIDGVRRDIGLGSCDLYSLAEAREQARMNRRAVREGRDPRGSQSDAPTFEECATASHADHTRALKNDRDRKAWLRVVSKHAFPVFGDRPIDTIKTADLRKLLVALADKPSVQKDLRQRFATIFADAIANGHRTDNPAGDVLVRTLPRNGNGHKRHYAALPHSQVRDAIGRIRGLESLPGRDLFELLVLTAVRSNEARGARWSEIDMKAATWTIPADRMKGGKEHRVPLSAGAMAVLCRTPANLRTGLVFPHHGKVPHDKVVPGLIAKAKLDCTVHGFRQSFKNWSAESGYSRELAEAALAHEIGQTAVERCYATSDLFDRRRELMEDWSRYVTG